MSTDRPTSPSSRSESSAHWGKRRRLSRLQRDNGAYVLLAADHGVSLGPMPGLEDFTICSDPQIITIFSGVVLNRGAVPRALPCDSSLGLIVQTFGSPEFGSHVAKRSIASLDQLMALSPDGIAVELNLSAPQTTESLEWVSHSIQAADSLGVPVLLMISVSTKKVATEAFVHALRIGVELGADLIKIGLPDEICDAGAQAQEKIMSIVRMSPPVVLAGGPAGPRFPDVVNLSCKLGFKGVCIGRNIFRSETRGDVLTAVSSSYLDCDLTVVND